MRCPECGKAFTPKRFDQAWCSSACNRVAGNRELARARTVYRALYRWRNSRTGEDRKDDFTFVCREVKAWIEEDKKAGRPPPPPHRHDADRGHLRRRG